jgi:hypothetical protein
LPVSITLWLFGRYVNLARFGWYGELGGLCAAVAVGACTYVLVARLLRIDMLSLLFGAKRDLAAGESTSAAAQ